MVGDETIGVALVEENCNYGEEEGTGPVYLFISALRTRELGKEYKCSPSLSLLFVHNHQATLQPTATSQLVNVVKFLFEEEEVPNLTLLTTW